MNETFDPPREAAEEVPGPSLESEDPQERIAARQIRIATRNETNKRQEQGGDPMGAKQEIKEERKSQQQVDKSQKRVITLLNDGTEIVTNIQTALHARESNRRTQLRETQRLRVEGIESEAESSQAKFEEINRGWMSAEGKVIPQEVAETLKSQQQLCAQLLQDKNKLITDLQRELKASDDRYVKDLKKQAEEVDLLIERMEEQVRTLKKTYREELDQMENAVYVHEREVLLTGNRNKWEQSLKERRDKELQNLLQRMKKVEEFEASLQKLRVESAEEYNTIKIKLDTDVQVLEQELQQMKATYQLNQEKLEYNVQVLKKRDEENTITKSQQKRKISRMWDVLNKLKSRCGAQEKLSKEEIDSLTRDYKRSVQECKDIQKKKRHFAAVSDGRHEEVWLMSEAEVKLLAEQALEIDRLLHEQQLGLAWERPPVAFAERPGHIRTRQRNRAQRSAAALRSASSHLVRSEGHSVPGTRDASAGPAYGRTESAAALRSDGHVEVDEEESEGSAGEERGKVSTRTVKRLLEVLCDEAGFLIESKLLKLLSPLKKDEQSLMKLDAIFSALGIESDDDVYKLAEFFIKYRRQQREQSEQGAGESGGTAEGEEDLIHPNEVLAVLKAFTAQCRESRERWAPHRALDDWDDWDASEDAAYWDSLANVIPESKLKVWDALENALDKYQVVLTERSKLIADTQSLKQRNAELRMLLHQSLNSAVNAELEIPPTQVMQLGHK